MNTSAKLIVIRGQSGSGKSTIASALQAKAKNPLIVLEQDYFRFMYIKEFQSDVRRELMIDLIQSSAKIILNKGHNVLIEGIFSSPPYKGMFEKIVANHPRNNHFFYFNNSFKETLRRHKTREKAGEFGKVEMKHWYKQTESYGFKFEILIPEESSLEQTLELIRKKTALY